MKKPRQMTVNFVVRVKGCKQDFGLGPGVLSKSKRVFYDRRRRGFDSPMFIVAMDEVRTEMINDVVQFQALVSRPPPELRKTARKVKGQ